MSIYTKTGDAGTTGLLGGSRVRKDDARIEVCGSLDETSCAVGVARASGPPPDVDRLLRQVQRDLFALGAELAATPDQLATIQPTLLGTAGIHRLEETMDALERDLPAVSGFVLPSGCRSGAALHQARAVCRRAERRAVTAGRQVTMRAEALVYLNRLSDLLYLLARRCNQAAGCAEDECSGHSGPA